MCREGKNITIVRNLILGKTLSERSQETPNQGQITRGRELY